MACSGYTCNTEGAVALTAATARTVIGVKAHANSGIQVKGFMVSFDGVTATAVPALVEFCYCTWVTNSPGTQSTSTTPQQTYGRSAAAGFTSGKAWVAANEPTVLTCNKEFLLAPDKGVIAYQWPLGQEPDSALAQGFAIRITAPAAVSVRANLDVERI